MARRGKCCKKARRGAGGAAGNVVIMRLTPRHRACGPAQTTDRGPLCCHASHAHIPSLSRGDWSRPGPGQGGESAGRAPLLPPGMDPSLMRPGVNRLSALQLQPVSLASFSLSADPSNMETPTAPVQPEVNHQPCRHCTLTWLESSPLH